MTTLGAAVNLLTIDRHRELEVELERPVRVLLDGVDVTDRCFVADRRAGYVGLYKLDANGRLYFDFLRYDTARELLHGRVEFVVLERVEVAA